MSSSLCVILSSSLVLHLVLAADRPILSLVDVVDRLSLQIAGRRLIAVLMTSARGDLFPPLSYDVIVSFE